MAAHRYWRIYVTGTEQTTNVDIKEVELRTSISGADQTGSGTASASASASGFEADKAFDNNAGTTWYFNRATHGMPQWLKYDFGLGNDKDIVEFTLTCWAAGEMVTDFELQYSDDDSAWSTLYTIAGEYQWAANETRAYSDNDTLTQNGAGSAWRVNVSAADGSPYAGIAEIQLRTSVSGSDVTGSGKAFASAIADLSHVAPNAFDNNTATQWANDGSLPDWIAYRFASNTSIAEITITARNDGLGSIQAPNTFTIEYWNGSSWVVTDTITGETGWSAGETRAYSVTPPALSSGRPVVFVCT